MKVINRGPAKPDHPAYQRGPLVGGKRIGKKLVGKGGSVYLGHGNLPEGVRRIPTQVIISERDQLLADWRRVRDELIKVDKRNWLSYSIFENPPHEDLELADRLAEQLVSARKNMRELHARKVAGASGKKPKAT